MKKGKDVIYIRKGRRGEREREREREKERKRDRRGRERERKKVGAGQQGYYRCKLGSKD